MAILKTCKVSIYVMAREINRVIEYLQESSIMEMAEGTKSLPESAIYGIERELSDVAQAISVARRERGGRGILPKRRPVPAGSNRMDDKHIAAARKCARDISYATGRIDEISGQIENIDRDILRLEAFAGFDGTGFSGESKYTKSRVMTNSGKNVEEFFQKIEKYPFYYEEISREKSQLIIFCTYLKRDAEEIEEILKNYGFASPEFSLSGRSPIEEIRVKKNEKSRLLKENKELSGKLSKLSKGLSGMELLYDILTLKKKRYSAFSASLNTEKVFILTGYVLKERIFELRERLAGMYAVLEEIPPDEDEVLPVAFSNNSFSAPVEEVTASYSMPAVEDIDPNPVMSVFYYWFFGMMFSDSGYGLLMMLVCGILGFSGLLKRNRRKAYRMFFWCGVFTTLWGIAYGSFFGDLIGTVSKVFGSGRTTFLPVIIDPVNQALELLIISVIFGLVHILTALIIKFYLAWRAGDKKGAVFDVGSWILVLLGAASFALGAAASMPALKNAGIAAAVIGALTIVIMGGRDKKSPIMRIFSGVLGLYDITGFVGDILSYSRLMALGLATGVIASVVNVLASLGGNSPLGIAMFVLVAVFGHTLNFAINMLGAYVHTNRLQYVEFYQKFYTGGGKRFRPLSMETEYFDFGDR